MKKFISKGLVLLSIALGGTVFAASPAMAATTTGTWQNFAAHDWARCTTNPNLGGAERLDTQPTNRTQGTATLIPSYCGPLRTVTITYRFFAYNSSGQNICLTAGVNCQALPENAFSSISKTYTVGQFNSGGSCYNFACPVTVNLPSINGGDIVTITQKNIDDVGVRGPLSSTAWTP